MIRAGGLLTILAMAGCTAPSAAEQPPIPERGSGKTCDAGKAQKLVGEPATPEVLARAKALAGAATARLLHPGDMATMDYRTDRLNVHVDAQGRIVSLACG